MKPPGRYRHTTRLRGYDYSSTGAYFITICTHQRECVFGDVDGSRVDLSSTGQIVDEEWCRSAEIREELELDEYVIMPNHIHGIVLIHRDAGMHGRAPRQLGQDGGESRQALQGHGHRIPRRHLPPPGERAAWERKPRSLGAFVAGFKSAVTARVNRMRNTPRQPVWQRNYHDHIIRDEESLRRIRRYIIENPMRWAEDPENPLIAADFHDPGSP